MNRFAEWIVTRRRLVIGLALAMTVLAAIAAGTLKTDMSVTSILPQNDEGIRYFQETGARFGSSNINMVALETADIFSHDSLTRLRALTNRLADVPGVRFTMSVTNLLDMQPDGEGSISVRPLVPTDAIPDDPAGLAHIRDTVLGNPMLAGNLASPDGKAALVTVMLAPDADRATVGAALIAAAKEAAGTDGLYVGGLEMVRDYVGRLIASPRMIAVMTAVFGVFLVLIVLVVGCKRCALWVVATLGLAVVWTLGAVAAAGITLSLFTSMLPLIVIVIAVPFPLLMVKTYQGSGGDAPAKVRASIGNIGGPLLFAGITVAAVGLTSLTMPWPLFRDLGVGVALGGFFAALLSITFLPAVLAGQKRASSLSTLDPALSMAALSRLAQKRAAALGVVAVAAIVFGAVGARLPRGVNPMGTFPADSEPRMTEGLMQRGFGGSQLFMIDFHTRDARRPAVLEQMTLATKRLRLIPHVNYPQSVADVLRMINTNLNNEPSTPDSMDKINNLWFMLEGQPQVDMLIEPHFADAIVQARIGDIVSDIVAPAVDEIEKVAGAVETKLVSVNLAERPESERGAWANELADQAARLAELDARFYGKKLDPVSLSERLAPLRAEPVVLTDEDRDDLVARWAAYFTSDEADIVLPDGFDTTALTAPLAALTDHSQTAFADAIHAALPPAVIAGDPEGPNYAATTVQGIYETVVKRARHRLAMSVVGKPLGIDWRDKGGASRNAPLGAELASSLWTLNAGVAHVTPERYKTITGAEPPADDVTAIEARVTGWPIINTAMNRALGAMFGRAGLLALALAMVGAVFATRSPGAALGVLATLLAVGASMTLFGVALDNITWVAVMIALGLAQPLAAGRGAGTPIIGTALPLAGGFALLGFAQMTMQAYLGLFIAVAAVVGAVVLTLSIPPGASSAKHGS